MVLLLFIIVIVCGGVTAVRPFRSVFISINSGPTVDWSKLDWDTAMVNLKKMGVENIILSSAVTEHAAHYPTKIPSLKQDGVSVDLALMSAAKFNISVTVGILLRRQWFSEGGLNKIYCNELLQEQFRIVSELNALYGKLISGWYGSFEMNYLHCPGGCLTEDAVFYGRRFVQPLGAFVKTASPSSIYVIAPFYENVTEPTEQVHFWSTVLRETPSLDCIAFQDGVGVQHVSSPQQAIDYIKPLSESITKNFPSLEFWTDVEVFRKYPLPRVPANFSRVLEQLTLESPFVQGFTMWEWEHYFNPANPNKAARELYQQYVNWYQKHWH